MVRIPPNAPPMFFFEMIPSEVVTNRYLR
eukprot:COSAG01_NODE_72435_length_253_cov_0.616883_1_plen_28_part_10